MFELTSIILAIISVMQLLERVQYMKRTKSQIAQKDQLLNETIHNMQALDLFKNGINKLIEIDIKNSLLSIQKYISKCNDMAMKKISVPIDRMVQLVSNVLSIEELKSCDLKMDLKPTLLSDLLIRSKRSIEQILQDKSIDLMIVLENDCMLLVNSRTVIDVLNNLLNSSIRFAPSHSKIVVSAKYVDGSSKVLEVSISSKGCILNEQDKTYFFNSYWKAQVEYPGVIGSTALSLAYCNLAILAHNGKMFVTCENKSDTIISLELPIVEVIGEKYQGFDKTEDNVELNFEDAQRLKSFVNKLKRYKVYRVASILQIISEIESMGHKTKWLEELKVSVYYSNEEKYENLLKTAEQ